GDVRARGGAPGRSGHPHRPRAGAGAPRPAHPILDAHAVDMTQSVSGLTEVLSWQVEAAGDERLRVQLRGEINENADFTELGRQLHGDVTLLLDGITRINSCGVREWVNFVRDLHVESLVFARCSPTVVNQLNA